MKSWEYKVIDSRTIEGGSWSWVKGKPPQAVEEYLNQLGADGWEVDLDWRELEHRMSFMGIAKRERQG